MNFTPYTGFIPDDGIDERVTLSRSNPLTQPHQRHRERKPEGFGTAPGAVTHIDHGEAS